MDIIRPVYNEAGALIDVKFSSERIEPGEGSDIKLDNTSGTEKDVTFIWKLCDDFFVPLVNVISGDSDGQ